MKFIIMILATLFLTGCLEGQEVKNTAATGEGNGVAKTYNYQRYVTGFSSCPSAPQYIVGGSSILGSSLTLNPDGTVTPGFVAPVTLTYDQNYMYLSHGYAWELDFISSTELVVRYSGTCVALFEIVE